MPIFGLYRQENARGVYFDSQHNLSVKSKHYLDGCPSGMWIESRSVSGVPVLQAKNLTFNLIPWFLLSSLLVLSHQQALFLVQPMQSPKRKVLKIYPAIAVYIARNNRFANRFAKI
jgi:hypothetical protein